MEAYSETYERYKKFCKMVGAPPLPFEQWMHVDEPKPSPVQQEIAKLLSSID